MGVANPNTYRLSVPDLPVDTGEFYNWQDRAACRGGSQAELFFAPDSERIVARERREGEAKKICSGCPVRQQCLEHALSFPEPAGVWGGLTADERDSSRREAKSAQDKARRARAKAQQNTQVAA
jgi:WhiB family redox-sensing transcriptional regulator